VNENGTVVEFVDMEDMLEFLEEDFGITDLSVVNRKLLDSKGIEELVILDNGVELVYF
jgi:hypothetical protein